MKVSILGLLIGLKLLMVTISCSQNKTSVPNIVNKISELPEYKKAQARIDSLSKTGMTVKIQIAITDSFYPEDSLKNISLAFIEEEYGFDQNILYEVRFIKTTEEIISVKPSDIK